MKLWPRSVGRQKFWRNHLRKRQISLTRSSRCALLEVLCLCKRKSLTVSTSLTRGSMRRPNEKHLTSLGASQSIHPSFNRFPQRQSQPGSKNSQKTPSAGTSPNLWLGMWVSTLNRLWWAAFLSSQRQSSAKRRHNSWVSPLAMSWFKRTPTSSEAFLGWTTSTTKIWTLLRTSLSSVPSNRSQSRSTAWTKSGSQAWCSCSETH